MFYFKHSIFIPVKNNEAIIELAFVYGRILTCTFLDSLLPTSSNMLFLSAVILFLHIVGLTGIAGELLAGAGISAVIFGFAFKDIAENFLAGIISRF
jgi:small-conductance mechanosensitive channel